MTELLGLRLVLEMVRPERGQENNQPGQCEKQHNLVPHMRKRSTQIRQCLAEARHFEQPDELQQSEES